MSALKKGRFILHGPGPDPCFPGFVVLRKPGHVAIAYDRQFRQHVISRNRTHWLLCPKIESAPDLTSFWDFEHPAAIFPLGEHDAGRT